MGPRQVAKFRMFLYTQVMPNRLRQSKEAEVGRSEALRRFKAEVFRVLAHPTRIHVVECLRKTELPVSTLLEQVRVEPANLSQHLSVLRSSKLVVTRKEGNQVFYALRDPLLIDVLDSMRRYFQAHLEESLTMLADLDQS